MPHLLQHLNLRPPSLPALFSSPTIATINSSRPFPPPDAAAAAASRGRSCAAGALVGHPTITCMANPRRVKMVAKQIRRELSDMLLTDKVLQYAVLPEAALGADRYLSSLTTISDVEVSGDLQVVKVYISVFGDERGRDVAIAGLKSKAKYIRSELGKRIKLRLTPEIRFIEDDSLERGSRVIAILDRLKDERESSGPKDEGQAEVPNLSQEDRDWNKDDPDEGIIYVD